MQLVFFAFIDYSRVTFVTQNFFFFEILLSLNFDTNRITKCVWSATQKLSFLSHPIREIRKPLYCYLKRFLSSRYPLLAKFVNLSLLLSGKRSLYDYYPHFSPFGFRIKFFLRLLASFVCLLALTGYSQQRHVSRFLLQISAP
jgi:hypothetical protein